MIQIGDTIDISVEQATIILQSHTDRCGVFLDADRVFEYQANSVKYTKPLLKEVRSLFGVSGSFVITDDDAIQLLKKRFDVPEMLFMSRDSAKPSIANPMKSQILMHPNVSLDAKYAIAMYHKYNEAEGLSSKFKQYAGLPLCLGEDYLNRRMLLARTEWVSQSTGRIGAREPSIQTIPKYGKDIVTYPKGYRHIKTDSGQIEPRIQYSNYTKDPVIKYLILLYNDAYYGMLHACYMSDKEYEYYCNNPEMLHKITKMEMTKEQRGQFKLAGLAGNYGGGLETGVSPEIVRLFKHRIVNNKYRLQFVKECEEAVDRGQVDFEDAFGNLVTPKRDYAKYSSETAWIRHLKRCAVNNPMQSTAARLMLQSVYVANKLLAPHPGNFISWYKHDEAAAYIKEDRQDLVDLFGEVTAYQVQDWIPIYSEVEEGQSKSTLDWTAFEPQNITIESAIKDLLK